MDNERNRKNHYMTMVLWIMVIVFDVSAIAVLTVWGRLENEVLIAAVVMSVFLLAIGIFAIWYTYRNHIEPARNDGNRDGRSSGGKRKVSFRMCHFAFWNVLL